MKDSQFIEIDFLKLFYALLRRIWVIFLCAVFFGAGAFSYAVFMIAPTYTADTLLYVNNSSFTVGNKSFTISSGELSAAQSLIDTYIVILNSRTTLDEITEECDLKYSYKQLKNMISAEAVSETEIFRVSVTSTDRNEAKLIANTIAKILPHRISEVVDGSSVRIVDYAILPTSKTAPNVVKITMAGVAIGIFLACAVIVLLQLFDTIIRDEDYLTNKYKNIPILAVIPDLSGGSDNSYGKYGKYSKYGKYGNYGKYGKYGKYGNYGNYGEDKTSDTNK